MASASFIGDPNTSLRQALRAAISPRIILRSLFVAAIIWLIMASLTPSYSKLMFGQQLPAYFGIGLGMALVSQMIVALVTSLLSSDHTTMATPQSPSAIILGMIVASVAAAAPADLPPDILFGVVFWILLIACVITGLAMLAAGLLRGGALARYIPFPIIGGYMAGFGWLLVRAGLVVTADFRVSLANLPLLSDADTAAKVALSTIFALVVLAWQSRVKSQMILPAAIVFAFALFFAGILATGADDSALREAGWLLPRPPDKLDWTLPDARALQYIDGPMIVASIGGVINLVVICAYNLFFRSSGQELVIERELDINRECTANGLANLLSGALGGGIAGYPTVAFAALVRSLGAYGRLVGVLLALMYLLTLMYGGALFALIPRFVPGGLFMFLGLRFMKEFLWDSRKSLPRKDYLVVVLIALTTALIDPVAGVGVGAMAAVGFFLLEYSRMNVVKQQLSGSIHRSNNDRSFAQNELLKREGGSILILRLQGYMFFGTAYRFYEYVKSRVEEPGAALRFLILDFRAITGFDVSTIRDFKKLRKLTDRHGIVLLISSPLPHLQPVLLNGGIVERQADDAPLFDDLDRTLEWCENILLDDARLLATGHVTVERQFANHAMIEALDVSALHKYLERIETSVGDAIIKQGDEPDAMYFIESGRVDVLLEIGGDQVLRLRSMAAGTVVGEVGYYLKQLRSASIVATEAGRAAPAQPRGSAAHGRGRPADGVGGARADRLRAFGTALDQQPPDPGIDELGAR